MSVQHWKYTCFQCLGCRTQKRDWAVGVAETRVFAWFRDWDYYGRFPDRRDFIRAQRQIEDLREVGDAEFTQMFQVKDGKAIRANRFRVIHRFNGPGDDFRCERRIGAMLEFVFVQIAVQDSLSLGGCSLYNRCELFIQCIRN